MPKLTENRIIRLLAGRYPAASRLVKKGIGDDAAVIRPRHADEYWLVTADMLLEGVDFRREWTTPRALGRKAIAVNLSDLAAMGARPRFFTVSLAVPSGVGERWILELYRGLTALGGSKGAHLIGGDLSRSESGVMISVAALGESLNRKILFRSGGRAGDLLYVTGVLGRSAAGLRLLETAGLHPRSPGQKEAVRAHRTPRPLCEAGVWLAQCGLVSCMMDLSDGLSMDLPRMCSASGVGAEIRTADLPLFSESRLWGCDPVELALHGGEDYELLFAVPEAKRPQFEKNYPPDLSRITPIGKMTGNAGRIWILGPGACRRRLPGRGYDHFRGPG
jgi:thiamine-monophosphate kinase